MRSAHYTDNVFINCPFDVAYKPLFDAMVFTVHDCGFIARGALIIADCRYGIHDISRTELDENSGFPRFNMPLEFGVFLGAKKFGVAEQKSKLLLIIQARKSRKTVPKAQRDLL